jgi:hypothetical protein
LFDIASFVRVHVFVVSASLLVLDGQIDVGVDPTAKIVGSIPTLAPEGVTPVAG